ncbi:MAG: hypothetical protein H0X33_14995 [Taibaiella sp.]|nr:hypothetical protein [Taibaiella sp.]
MKKLFPIAMVAAFGILSFASCKKSSTSSGPAANTMTATIAGSSYTSSSILSSALDSNGSLFLVGLDANFKGIEIIGAYSNTTGNISGMTGVYLENTTTQHAASNVTLNVSSYSTHNIQGTFSFTTTDNIAITNGNFNLTIK